MSDDNDHKDLDLRTTPHSYRRSRRGLWVVVLLAFLVMIVAYAWLELKLTIFTAPRTGGSAVEISPKAAPPAPPRG